MSGLPAEDRAVLDRAEAAAARGQAAAEGLARDVAILVAEVTGLRAEVARLQHATAVAVTDAEHPGGATYLVQGCGASKTWIRDGQQWADLVNAFPFLAPAAPWAGRSLAKIPTIGEDPDPPSKVAPDHPVP